MNVLTTEARRHREIGEEDPRTGPIIGAAIEVHQQFSGKRVGLLINFNVPLLTWGIIKRVL